MKPITIFEYESFSCNREENNYIPLPEKTFNSLEEFILVNNEKNNEILNFFNISIKKGVGKVITAKNYVGVVSMNDGTTIEILPKIYSKAENDEKEKSKKLLLNMLKTLKTAPYKNIQKTNIATNNNSIFEIFIRMFTDEIFLIVKHGLKCNYESVSENINVFKGKIVFSKHINHNLVHKEKFYVEYDDFNSNRAENKLIKSTLLYLYKKTNSNKNKNDIRTLLNSFDAVDESKNHNEDFSKCISERNTKGYTNALNWCKVFLQGKSFCSFSGSNIAYALLFPMEKLFESYVADLIRKELNGTDYLFYKQVKEKHLFVNPPKFLLKPDILIKNKYKNEVFVIDTKWKILSNSKNNFGISQIDMYQMYAYSKKYKSNSVTLLYPKTIEIFDNEKLVYYLEDNAKVSVKFIDLFDDNSVNKILNEIIGEC